MKNKTNNNIGTFKFSTALIIITIFICLMSITHVFAQTDELKRVEISAGYSRTQASDLTSFSTTALIEIPNPTNGWSAGAAYKFKKWVSIYAEGDQDYGKLGDKFATTRSTRTSLLGGARFYLVNKTRFTPIMNAGVGDVRLRAAASLIGGVHVATPTYSKLLFVGGGGVDVAINKKKKVSWRTVVEYRRGPTADNVALFADDGKKRGNAFRLNTGIVFNF